MRPPGVRGLTRRAGQAVEPTHEGMGPGHSLVREVVKVHGGSVHFESTAEAGTPFAVRLPAEAPASHLAP